MNFLNGDSDVVTLRSVIATASNDLFDTSVSASALSGLLRLISGNTEHIDDNQRLAFGALEDIALRVERELLAISQRLSDSVETPSEFDVD